VIGSAIAPAEKNKWPRWLDPRKLLADFRSQLGPARDIDAQLGLDSHTMGVEDWLRQVFGSSGRAMQMLRTGGVEFDEDKQEFRRRLIPDGTRAVYSIADGYAAAKEDGGNMRDLMRYRIAQRIIEKSAPRIENGEIKFGQPMGWDNPRFLEAARTIVDDPAERAKYQRATDMIREAKDSLIDYGTEAGLWSADRAREMKEQNREHIVFRRVIDPTYNPRRPGRSFGVRDPVKFFKGSSRQIVDPMTTEIDNFHTIVAMADRNRALGKIIELAQAGKFPPGWEPLEFVKHIDEDTGRVDITDEDGNPVPKEARAALTPFLAQRATGGRGPDDFVYINNGVPELWRADSPELAQILRANWQGDRSPWFELATKFARLQRAGITIEPSYVLRSLIHSQVAKAAFSKNGGVPFHDVMTGALDVFKMGEHWDRWEMNGGAGTALTDLDRDIIQQGRFAMFDASGTSNMVLNSVRHPIEAMRILQHNADAASRIGYMKRQENAGFSTLKAATMSRTAHFDFAEARSRAWVNNLAQMTPFMMSGLKDIDQVVRAFQDRPWETAMKASLYLVLPTVVTYAINRLNDKDLPEEQKYSNLPQWERDMYWVMPQVNGIRIRIMKPYVGGLLFGTMTERFLDAMVAENPRAFDNIMEAVLHQAVAPFFPVIGAPLFESWANKSMFTGRPIIQASVERASGYMQYSPSTSLLSRKIAQILGPPGMNVADVSPAMLDQFIKDWGGTLPMAVLKAIDAKYKDPGPPQSWADNPFFGSFIARNPGIGAQPIEDLYKALDRYDQHKADIAAAKRNGDIQEWQRLQREGYLPNLDYLRKALNGTMATVRAISESRMTNEEKQTRIDSMANLMIRNAKAGLQLLHHYGI
jgi:hypothetical protein